MSVANQRRGERERELLATAASLFRQRGYASTTMRDIAAAAGVNHATAHYYLQSKAAILDRIYTDAFAGLEREFADEAGLPAPEALARVVRWAIIELARNPDSIAVFFQELRWLEQHFEEEQAKELREREATLTRRIRNIIERGIEEETIRPVDARMAVAMIVSNIAGAYSWYVPKSPAEAEATADEYADLILNGLRR